MIPITRRLGGASLLLAAGLAFVACGGDPASVAPTLAPTVAPSASVEATPAPSASDVAPSPSVAEATPGTSLPTTGRIEIPDSGIAVTLPQGWTRVDLDGDDLAAAIAASGEIDPALAEQYGAQIQQMVSAGLSLFALGPDPAAGTTLTILALPAMGLSLDLLEQLNASQLEALSEGDIESERVTLPAGEAIHFTYAMPVDAIGTTSRIHSYLLLAGDNQVIVQATGASDADVDAIANSIEVLD